MIQLDGVRGDKYRSNGAGADGGGGRGGADGGGGGGGGGGAGGEGSSLTVRSRAISSAASRRTNLEVTL